MMMMMMMITLRRRKNKNKEEVGSQTGQAPNNTAAVSSSGDKDGRSENLYLSYGSLPARITVGCGKIIIISIIGISGSLVPPTALLQ